MHHRLINTQELVILGPYRSKPQFLFLDCSPSLCLRAVPELLEFQRLQRRWCLVFSQNNLWQLINVNPVLTLESVTDTLASSSIAFCSQEDLIFTDLSLLHIVPATGEAFTTFL